MVETYYQINIPLRIALLADLHGRPFHEVEASLCRNRPELIAIAGDIASGGHRDSIALLQEKSAQVLPFLQMCASLAPSYLSAGNHEWMLTTEEKELIARTGVHFLDNTWTGAGRPGPGTAADPAHMIWIGGLSSGVYTAFQSGRTREEIFGMRFLPKRKRSPRSLPDTSWLPAFAALPGYKILLCHQPEYRDRYLQDYELDLILSGHAHGGQIRIFGQGLLAPGQGWLPKYTSGVHGNLVISRGLANTAGIIPRLGNPTEIVYLS